jgi:hypothetical protein
MATATGFDLMKELGIRSQGRNPKYTLQAARTGAPASAAAGVSIEDAIVTMIDICPRFEVHNHSSRVLITAYDLTLTTYTVTIDGTAVAYDASAELPATSAELLNGIAQEINDNATANLVVLATVEDLDADGVAESIVLRNITGEANTHTTAVSTAGGSGVLSFAEDAISMEARIYLLPENNSLVRLPWRLVNSAEYVITYRGFCERFETSGNVRAYVEIHTITGPVSPVPSFAFKTAIGPCAVES